MHFRTVGWAGCQFERDGHPAFACPHSNIVDRANGAPKRDSGPSSVLKKSGRITLNPIQLEDARAGLPRTPPMPAPKSGMHPQPIAGRLLLSLPISSAQSRHESRRTCDPGYAPRPPKWRQHRKKDQPHEARFGLCSGSRVAKWSPLPGAVRGDYRRGGAGPSVSATGAARHASARSANGGMSPTRSQHLRHAPRRQRARHPAPLKFTYRRSSRTT
jgi:hypothetical protein